MRPGARLLVLSEIRRESNYCWVADLPDGIAPGDVSDRQPQSALRLFEDDREIGPGHSLHDEIREIGGGRFSHWGRQCWFSSSDNADPTSSGRCYRILVPDDVDGIGAVETAKRMLAASGEPSTDADRYALAERVFNAIVPDVYLSEHGRIWLQNRAFIAEYERFEPTNHRSLDRKFALDQLATLIDHVPGDMAECGVFKGQSAALLCRHICDTGSHRRVHLFDSFQGLSHPDIRDGLGWSEYELACELSVVQENLATFDFVEFHPGWIPTRFADVAELEFSLVHIDVDLYEPTKASVEFFYPRVAAGGLMIFDDYGSAKCPGAKWAIDEFFADKKESLVHLPTSQAFMIKR
jgi:hypothetical protein